MRPAELERNMTDKEFIKWLADKMKDQEQISEIQFDMFWMKVDKPGEVCIMSLQQLKDWSKLIWNKSREVQENSKIKSEKTKKYPVVFDTDYEMMMKDNSIEKDKIIEHILESKKEKIEFQKKWKGKKLSLKEVEERIDEFAMITFDGKEILV